MNSNFKDIVRKISTNLSDDLTKVNNVLSESTETGLETINHMYSYISSSKGKMLRPIFTILVTKLYKPNTEALNKSILLAAAIELIHITTLLHDDVIDKSELRHDKKTLNLVFSNKMAILMGDFLFSKAFQLMVKTNNLEVLKTLSEAAAIISKGEIMQIDHIGNTKINYEDYLKVISSKTSELFKSASYVGGLVAGCSENDLIKLQAVGHNFGIAFQIIDDINDYIADEVASGKKVGDDFVEKKVTLPLMILLENASPDECEYVKNLISQREEINFQNSKIVDLLNKYDCFNLSKQKAFKYVSKGLEAINSLDENNTLDKVAKECLMSLLNSLCDNSVLKVRG